MTTSDTNPAHHAPHEVSGHHAAGNMADRMIAREVEKQDTMWGVANDRADSTRGQLLAAAMAQGHAIHAGVVTPYVKRSVNFEDAQKLYYPQDWSGFRDYGSDVVNLVVMAAYIRQEIKRRIANGEPTTRTSRDPVTQPYTGDQPPTSAA